MGIDTEALVMGHHLVSCRTCCPFELEKGKWREELSKPKLGPYPKFEVEYREIDTEVTIPLLRGPYKLRLADILNGEI